MTPGSRGFACLAVAFAIFGAACSSASDVIGPGSFPPAPGKVTVNMSEYRFVYASRVPAGRTVFSVTNAGRSPHRLSLFALPPDSPPIDLLVRDPRGLRIEPLAQMPMLPPGGEGSLAVELELGARYALVSLWPSPRGVPDAQLGMTSEFRAVRPLRTTTPSR